MQRNRPVRHWIFIAAALVATVAPSVAADPPSDLFARMARVNANLQTYQADMHVDIAMHTFPFISPSLDGNAYYKRPDKNAIVFKTVPALASAFQKVYPQIPPPSEWKITYDVTPGADDGTVTTFRLVPKKNGRVDHIDARVDDKAATVVSEQWFYKDGGSISLAQNYETIDGNFVVQSQSGKVDLPSYKADIKSAFSNYKLNVAVADRVFQQ